MTLFNYQVYYGEEPYDQESELVGEPFSAYSHQEAIEMTKKLFSIPETAKIETDNYITYFCVEDKNSIKHWVLQLLDDLNETESDLLDARQCPDPDQQMREKGYVEVLDRWVKKEFVVQTLRKEFEQYGAFTAPYHVIQFKDVVPEAEYIDHYYNVVKNEPNQKLHNIYRYQDTFYIEELVGRDVDTDTGVFCYHGLLSDKINRYLKRRENEAVFDNYFSIDVVDVPIKEMALSGQLLAAIGFQKYEGDNELVKAFYQQEIEDGLGNYYVVEKDQKLYVVSRMGNDWFHFEGTFDNFLEED